MQDIFFSVRTIEIVKAVKTMLEPVLLNFTNLTTLKCLANIIKYIDVSLKAGELAHKCTCCSYTECNSFSQSMLSKSQMPST